MIRPYKKPLFTQVSFEGDTWERCMLRQWAVDLMNSLRSNPDARDGAPVTQRLSRKTDKEECVTVGAEYDANEVPFRGHAAWNADYPSGCKTGATGQCSLLGYPSTWYYLRQGIYVMYNEKTTAGCDNPANYCLECGHWYIMTDSSAKKVAIGFFDGDGASYDKYINLNFYSS